MPSVRPFSRRPLLFVAAIGAALAASASIAVGQAGASTSVSVLPLTITSTDSAVTANPLTDFTYGVTTNVGDPSAPSIYVWTFALPFGASLQLLPNGSVAVIRPESPPSDLGEMTEDELEAAETLFAQERNGDPDPPVSAEDEQAAAALDTYDPLPEAPWTGDEPESSTDEPMSPEYWDPLTAPDEAAEGDYFNDPNYSPPDWNPFGGSDSLTLLSGAQETADGEVIAVVSTPKAADAADQAVPSRLAVNGSTMTLTIDHNLAEYAYPVTARSLVTEDADLETEPAGAQVQCQRFHYGRVNTWNPFGWDILAEQLAEFPATCTRYYIAIPPIAPPPPPPGQPPPPPLCLPRGGGVAAKIRALNNRPRVRDRGASFHALAQFNWERCQMSDPDLRDSDVVEIARRFRDDMKDRGYLVSQQETWAIDEIPCPVRESSWWRNRARLLISTLHDGGGDMPQAPGVVYMVWKQQSGAPDRRCPAQETLSQYKTVMKDWTLRGAFWQRMRTPEGGQQRRVRLWGQEVYTDCAFVCIPAPNPTWEDINAKANHVNAYIQHHARLAFARGRPAGTKQAARFFDVGYMPLLNGFWLNDIFHTQFSLNRMRRLVSLQTYAARAWSLNHIYPDRRIGFAWNQRRPDGLNEDQWRLLRQQFVVLARRIARSIEGAYGLNGVPKKACSPTGNDPIGCNPQQSGANFNNNWNIFSSWN